MTLNAAIAADIVLICMMRAKAASTEIGAGSESAMTSPSDVLLLELAAGWFGKPEREEGEHRDRDREEEERPSPPVVATGDRRDPPDDQRAERADGTPGDGVERAEPTPSRDRVAVGQVGTVDGQRVRLRDANPEAGDHQHEGVHSEPRSGRPWPRRPCSTRR